MNLEDKVEIIKKEENKFLNASQEIAQNKTSMAGNSFFILIRNIMFLTNISFFKFYI